MGAKWGRCVKNSTILCGGISGHQKIPQSLNTRNHKMSRCRTALPPAALPSLSMATSAMDPNRGGKAPYKSNAGAWCPGSRALQLIFFCWRHASYYGCIMCKIPQLWDFLISPKFHRGERFLRQMIYLSFVCKRSYVDVNTLLQRGYLRLFNLKPGICFLAGTFDGRNLGLITCWVHF